MDQLHDSFQQHISDTLKTGDGLCDPHVVEMVVKEGPDRLKEMIGWGAQFDCTGSGKLALGLEGGHSAHRIIHAKDETGFQMVKTLLLKLNALPNIDIRWNCLATDLRIEGNGSEKKCLGVSYLRETSENIYSICAGVTILATGGAGQVYALTTNPKITTGDGIAMAYRAGAVITDMQFVQFHPTALKVHEGDTAFLISEALRGFGAHLCWEDGTRFMFSYDQRGEMASRDIVARAIYKEAQHRAVYLDCRHLPYGAVKKNFPTIYHHCLSSGIQVEAMLIPVGPAAHYVCGGIATDMNAKTSIRNLYAIGECARTGLHGANRLASNSLLEALVFAHRCVADIERELPFNGPTQPQQTCMIDDRIAAPAAYLKETQKRIKKITSASAGIIRSHKGLRLGKLELDGVNDQINAIFQNFKPTWLLYETRNLLNVAHLILEQSLQQTENKGTFYNADVERMKQPRLYGTSI